MLNEKNQTQKSTSNLFHFYDILRKRNIMLVTANQWLPGAPDRGGWILIRKGQKEMVVIEMF